MKLSKKPLFLSLLLLFPAILSGQNYSFMELSPEKGFPSKINTIFVEQDGFAWLGSDDGLYLMYSNSYFSHHNPDEGYLASNYITDIYCDDTGMSWILTDSGFYGYNSRVHLEHPQVVLGFDGKTVVYSVISKDENVYFGGQNKVWKYSHDTGEFTEEIAFETSEPFTVDKLLFGYGNGGHDLIMLSDFSKEMYICNTATHELRKSNYPDEKDFFASFVDSNGVLWVSELGKGIFSIAADGSILKRFSTANTKMNSDLVLCIAERAGKLWLGTDGGGINILDPENGDVTILANDPHNPASCPANMVSTMFCDHNGNVWCGRPSGGAFVVSQPLITSYPNGSFDPPVDNRGICCIYQIPGDKRVWIGTNGSGIISYDADKDSFQNYPSTAGMHIHSMAVLKTGELALSCPNVGVLVFNPKTGALRKSIYEFEAKNYYFSTERSAVFTNDVEGNVVIFAENMSRYFSSGALEEYPKIAGVKGYLRPVTGSRAQYIIDDVSLYRWEESAACKLRRIRDFSEFGILRCAAFSDDGSIWISSGPSIFRYDTSSSEVTKIGDAFETTPHMLMYTKQDQIWFGTRNKLYCYSPITKSMQLLGAIDGVIDNEYMSGACLQASNGDIFFGGRNGIVRVDRNFSVSPVKDPEITVAAVVVDGVEVFDFGDYEVPFKHSNFDIRMLVRSHDILQSCAYHVKVEGPRFSYDEYLTIPEAHFLRLRSGKYKVWMSCTTSDGRWTDMQEIYSFKVKNPWYLTVWFFLACILLFVGANALIFVLHNRNKAKIQAKAASEERYNFLINVAHELRTPLTLVMGPLRRILEDRSYSVEQKNSLKRIYQQSSRMSELLNTVLTTNKIEEGATKINPQPVGVNKWVANLSDDFREEASVHNMDIVLKLDPSVGTAMIDENLCTVVFSNIMSNAIKHNLPGHHITVWTGWNRENGFIKVAVRDHGNGIGNVDVTKLFEQYYKATEDHTGFGIGLTYAKVIIEAHGGRIGAYNNDDEIGATFWFEIPADREGILTADQVNMQIKAREAEIEEKALIDKCILYVDDNTDMRNYIVDELGPICRKLITASNGKAAIKAIQNHNVDVVITDIIMPDIDGITLCKTIKFSDHYKHIKVIILTAKTDLETMNLSKDVHADAFIPKPFEMQDILDAIDIKKS